MMISEVHRMLQNPIDTWDFLWLGVGGSRGRAFSL